MYHQRSSYVLKLYFESFWTLLDCGRIFALDKCNVLTKIGYQSYKMNPNVCYYNAAKHFKLSNYHLRASVCALKHPKSDCFLWQNTEVNFWIPMQEYVLLIVYSNANLAMNIRDFQQKYVGKILAKIWLNIKHFIKQNEICLLFKWTYFTHFHWKVSCTYVFLYTIHGNCVAKIELID